MPGPTTAVAKCPEEPYRGYWIDVEQYLERVGGRASVRTLKTLFPIDGGINAAEMLAGRFNVTFAATPEDTGVELRKGQDKVLEDTEFVAKRVLKELMRRGGVGDMHDITRRFGIAKKKLLNYERGQFFGEEPGGQLVLLGGAGKVARAAKAAGTTTFKPGRWTRGSLLTSTGAAVDRAAADRLQLRIEGFLTTVGEGTLPAKMVYEALDLTPSPALRRWFKKCGLTMGANGNLSVADYRLAHYRVRRAVAVADVLANNGGVASWDMCVTRVHRPWELEELGADSPAWIDTGPPVARAALPTAAGPKLGLPAPADVVDGHRSQDAAVYLADASEQGASVALAEIPDVDSAEGADPSSELVTYDAPLWIEVWLRHFFIVEESSVYFPPDPVFQRPSKPHPDTPPPLTMAEEKILIQKVEEEMHLRYGRANDSVLTGCFEGVRLRLLKRFFDVTTYGDVMAKSVARQMREAIAISRRIMESEGRYTADECWMEMGMTPAWLKTHFVVAEDGRIGFDKDATRAWNAPLPVHAPNPFKYAKLNVPEGYIRKGDGKYGPMNYRPGSGGILY